MIQQQVKIAILGAGNIAAIHIEGYLQFPELCRVTAVCDLFADKAQKLADDYGLSAAVYKTLEEVLEKGDVDAVSICLPPETHCGAAVKALAAGKHVLCEKPMASSLEECDLMIAAAQKSGKHLSVVCQNRFKTPMRKVKTLIDREAAGKVLFATVNSLWWRGQNYYDLWWRGTWEKEGGGCVTSHAVHHIDLLQWMLGMPQKVTAVIANLAHFNSECEDVGMAILEYGGSIAQITASVLSHGEEQEMIFQCERGRMTIPWDPMANKTTANGFPETDEDALVSLRKAYAELEELDLQDHPAQIRNFLGAIRGEEFLLIDGCEGRKTIELIMAIYKAAVTHMPAELPLRPDDPFYRKDSIQALMPHFHEKTKSVDNFVQTKFTLPRDVGK